MTNDWVTAACIDKNGKLWAAVETGGIDICDNSSWLHMSAPKVGNTIYNRCYSLALSKSGEIWGIFWLNVSTAGRAPHIVAKYNGTEWIVLSAVTDVILNREIFIDNNNVIWFFLDGVKSINNGTIKQISDVVKKDLRLFRSNPGSASSILSAIGALIDSKGNLWLYGNARIGLVKIKNGRWNY